MKKNFLIALASLTIAAVACQLASSVTLRVVNHPKPEFPPPGVAAFEAAGCTFDEYGKGVCPPDSPVAALGCDQLHEADGMLGALAPTDSLALCLYYPTQHAAQAGTDPFNEPHIYNDGCMMPAFVRYALAREGEFHLLSTAEDLRTAFAPVESADEALSYSLAATGLSAYYDLKRELGYRYFIDKLEDTKVRQMDGGYQINLYRYQVCGCGPHTTSVVNVQVSPAANLQTLGEQPAFENPAEDSLCVD